MKNSKFYLLYFITFFLLLVQAIFSQNQGKIELEAIEKVALKDLNESEAPGAVIAVYKDGKLRYQKAFGIMDKKTKIPVNTNTLFLTASVTKVITTAALLTVCEEQGIDLNTPIGAILNGLSPKLSQITIHEILSMSSGIIDYLPSKKKYKADRQSYFEHFGDKLVSNELQSVFSYTNIGHVLAASLLSELNDSTFFEAVQKIIFDPLEMNSSTYYEGVARLESMSSAHTKEGRVDHKLTFPFIQPAASLFSNVSDLSRFALCFMNDGVYNGNQVLSESVIKMMSTGYTPIGVLHQYLGYPGSKYNYGLMGYNYKGIQFLGHPGESGSQNTLFVMAPEHNAFFIVMSNTGFYPFIKTLEKMIDTILPVSEVSENKINSILDLKKYVGKYYKPNIQGTKTDFIHIRMRSKKLVIELSEEEYYDLEPQESDRFTYEKSGSNFTPEIIFYKNEEDQINFLNVNWKTYVRF